MKYELRRWLSFTSIEHPHIKLLAFKYPAIAAFIFSIIFILWPHTAPINSANGIFAEISSVVRILPAFFLASLAAVATFNRAELDTAPPDPDAMKMIMRTAGQMVELNVTSRIFLTSLFSYLTGISFCLLIFSSIAKLMWPGILHFADAWTSPEILPHVNLTLEFIIIFLAAYLISKLIFCGSYGLYFLSEKIHRPNNV